MDESRQKAISHVGGRKMTPKATQPRIPCRHPSEAAISIWKILRKNTQGALEAPPGVLPFWLFLPLLLLCGFLCGLLCGCLLGCLFRCHLPILPFSMGCIDPAITNAVEECIDSCCISVKKKTTHRWKKWQQFFLLAFGDRAMKVTTRDAT